jgi:hypothetical protein
MTANPLAAESQSKKRQSPPTLCTCGPHRRPSVPTCAEFHTLFGSKSAILKIHQRDANSRTDLYPGTCLNSNNMKKFTSVYSQNGPEAQIIRSEKSSVQKLEKNLWQGPGGLQKRTVDLCSSVFSSYPIGSFWRAVKKRSCFFNDNIRKPSLYLLLAYGRFKEEQRSYGAVRILQKVITK